MSCNCFCNSIAAFALISYVYKFPLNLSHFDTEWQIVNLPICFCNRGYSLFLKEQCILVPKVYPHSFRIVSNRMGCIININIHELWHYKFLFLQISGCYNDIEVYLFELPSFILIFVFDSCLYGIFVQN